MKKTILMLSPTTFIFSFILVSLAFSITGCSATVSSDIDIDAFYVEYTVEKTSNTTATANAVYRVGGSNGTYIELVDGDKVKIDDKEMILDNAMNIFNQKIYIAEMPVKDSYTFTLTKDEKEYTDTGKMPVSADVVSVNATFNAPTLTIGDPFTVAWNNYSASSKIIIELEYYTPSQSPLSTNRFEDNSQKKFSVTNPYFWRQDSEPGSGSVRVKRLNTKKVNPAYKGGYFDLINSSGNKMDVEIVDHQ